MEIRETKTSYKKIVHKNGKITGAILQGDLAYGGILQQLIARKIDITKVKKPVFDIDYSDFTPAQDGNSILQILWIQGPTLQVRQPVLQPMKVTTSREKRAHCIFTGEITLS